VGALCHTEQGDGRNCDRKAKLKPSVQFPLPKVHGKEYTGNHWTLPGRGDTSYCRQLVGSGMFREMRYRIFPPILTAVFASIGVSADSHPVNLPFKDMNGSKVKVSDLRGKPVVLNFWATWCVPCRAEMPLFVEAEKEYTLRGVTFVGASLDDRQSRRKIPDFVNEFKIGFPIWVGASTMDLDDLKLGAALPATAFLDRDGRIVARVLGQITRQELHERLEWLTGKGPAPNPLVQNVAEK
jgi:thiol-disulfide isomerase/thioredoxin